MPVNVGNTSTCCVGSQPDKHDWDRWQASGASPLCASTQRPFRSSSAFEQVSFDYTKGDLRAAARPRIGGGPNFKIYMSQPVRVTVMRKLSTITADVVSATRARSFPRRPVRAVYDSLTVLCLFKHDENDTQLYVSHNDDPLCAVWIRKQPLLIDPKFCGRFVVITLTKALATEKGLNGFQRLDFDKYIPEERKQLEAAVEAAHRARTRHRAAAGYTQSTMGSMGRNTFA